MGYWTFEEEKFLRSLKNPDSIQHYLDSLAYNPVDDALSARYAMLSGDAHCLEGGFIACAALEFLGKLPLMVSLQAEDDDHHVRVVYKEASGWGAISKSNTTLLRNRAPVYKSIRELVMSYFDFYFNSKGKKSLYAYSNPINLNSYKTWNWRTGEENLKALGIGFNELTHFEIVNLRLLKSLPRASHSLKDACFMGADLSGLY